MVELEVDEQIYSLIKVAVGAFELGRWELYANILAQRIPANKADVLLALKSNNFEQYKELKSGA
jgi:hypothetical protein